MPVIATDGLTKRYPGVTALDWLTLSVEPGIIGLVGANGAGKSTLIKILLGLLPATRGSASVLGLDSAREGARIRGLVGYMPEHDCLPPDISATELVVHLGRISGLPAAAARERAADGLEGTYERAKRLAESGIETRRDQRVLLVELADDRTYETIRDAVADLGLGLVRLEQRRHSIEDLFRIEAPAESNREPMGVR